MFWFAFVKRQRTKFSSLSKHSPGSLYPLERTQENCLWSRSNPPRGVGHQIWFLPFSERSELPAWLQQRKQQLQPLHSHSGSCKGSYCFWCKTQIKHHNLTCTDARPANSEVESWPGHSGSSHVSGYDGQLCAFYLAK